MKNNQVFELLIAIERLAQDLSVLCSLGRNCLVTNKAQKSLFQLNNAFINTEKSDLIISPTSILLKGLGSWCFLCFREHESFCRVCVCISRKERFGVFSEMQLK